MFNKLLLFFFILLQSFSLNSQDNKTRNDFVPPEPQEKPFFEIFNEVEPADGIAISSLGVLSGIFITVGCTYDLLNLSLDDPYNVKLQENIAGTGLALLGTGLCTLALEFFITKAKESN